MKINSYVYVNASKPNTKGEFPVQIILSADGKKVKVNTGLFTTTKFSGCEFPSKERNAKAKTACLRKIALAVEEYTTQHRDDDYSAQMIALREIITGKKHKVECFADYVEKFMVTKERKGTAILYRLTASKVREFDPLATFDTITVDWLERFEKHFLKTM